MSSQPWDVPVTEEGRGVLVSVAEQFRCSGKTRELGITLSRLAHVVKHVGSGTTEGAFDASARLGHEAVALLRHTDDKSELARALRVSAVPLVDGIDHSALLNESLAIAREIGDLEEEGWTLYRMTRANGVSGVTIQDALACFEACACLSGQATCLLSIGFSPGSHRPDVIDEAVELFEKAGDHVEAERARKFAQVARSMTEA